MHDDRNLVEQRINRAMRERIAPATYADSVPLTLSVWHVPDEPVPVEEAMRASFRNFGVGEAWGPPWSTSWFRIEGTVPAHWVGKRVEAVLDLGFVGKWPGAQAEALVYDATGRPIKGIAPRNQYVPVADPATGGEKVSWLVEAAANPEILTHGFRPTALGDKATAGKEPLYKMLRADLAVLDTDVWHLQLDVEVLSELMLELSEGDPRRYEILRALERALDILDADGVREGAVAARELLRPALSSPAHASAHTLSAVGHAHIDSAWLWPLRETVRKVSRTFANVTALGREYPELVFACSQAQQYAWVKKSHPDIYERMKDAIKGGQWAPVGGMWVEADGNLPGGEALARQLVHGKRFFLDEFGVESQGVWLPDSFGYTAAYPQLARLAGARWFLTQKLSWNDTNPFPHHTFWWEGIDGSRVFTHFPPVDTYNARVTGAEAAHAVRNYSEKGQGTRSLMPFGYGDGGGGPTREMLERARRLRDLEGSARVVVEHPDAFFTAAQDEYPQAPVWSGELYLELHRATYTSQARCKAGNRRSEHLLREAELWAATATVQTGAEYPYDALDRLWKTVLLHQFHDILPGSSIAWVHQEAEVTYQKVREELEDVIAASQQTLGGEVFNAGPYPRSEVAVVAADGAQQLSHGTSVAFVEVPALGTANLEAHRPPPAVTVTREGGSIVLDNGVVRVEVDGDGLLASVRDLAADRELLAGRGNLLQLHPDLPSKWDAWDVERQYRHHQVDLTDVDSVDVIDEGPLIAAVRVQRSFRESRIVQTVSLRAGSPRIDVANVIDWHEQEKILKVAFPLDVHADRSAAEIQFGHVFRPTHTNTSWDSARFELYAHRWIHVAEPGYGAAVLTEATYGYDCNRMTRVGGGTTTTVRLSLVRGPKMPDPMADQGRHEFRYALLPGAGIPDAIAEAYAFNLPLRAHAGRRRAAAPPLVTVAGDAIVVEAVKLADDRSGDVVVRLYESRGGKARGVLRAGFPLVRVAAVDLLERPLSAEALAVDADGGVALSLRPFQILTLRLSRS
jgi:alpha-mannosidase